MTTPKDWHIFCRVIDNFGDIGVCWRLALQLHRRFSCQVTLWVDDLPSFQALCPAVATAAPSQQIQGVHVRHWREPLPELPPGEVVIEAFGCHLPEGYIAAMRECRPLWLNLEYLSAETWVKDYHLNQSPVHGLRKTFFFPGFEPGTGGLLWEPALAELADADATKRGQWRSQLGLAPAQAGELTLSLFAYQNAALPDLLNALSHYRSPVTLLVPRGLMAEGVNRWLGTSLEPHQHQRRGQLQLVGLPFLSQPDYDLLLALCDLNFVRGEESFVRSQVLGRPMIWHIYPQEEAAHLAKLAAFLDLYLAPLDKPLAAQIALAHTLWNQPQAEPSAPWHDLLDQLCHWQQHAHRWRQQLCQQGDLASNIVQFCTNQV